MPRTCSGFPPARTAQTTLLSMVNIDLWVFRVHCFPAIRTNPFYPRRPNLPSNMIQAKSENKSKTTSDQNRWFVEK